MARILDFRRPEDTNVKDVKHALMVAAVIAAVMLINNMTGRKLETIAA